ncbi:MAG TPA: site-2 protease family protein [Candidatus Saccharimonadales bacterium]
MLLIFGVLMFVLLVVIHEFGHYLAAKRNGVIVEEFGVGYPPRITGRRFKKNGTIYSLNWLPLGGFVRLKGEHDADDSAGSYGAARFHKKVLILLAGVGMNLVAAAIILTALSWVGLPKLVENQFSIASDTRVIKSEVLITYVEPESVADGAGLSVGDRLLSLDGQAIKSADELPALAQRLAGRQVELVTSSAGETMQQQVRLDSEGGDDGYLGVVGGNLDIERSGWTAPIRGVGLTAQFGWLTLKGVVTTVGQLFSGQGSAAAENVAGPVGIVVLLKDVSQAGLNFVLFFVALISVTLAVMNALPIPALDGGRLFVSFLFRVMKRPLSAKTEERIHATGMAVLLTLVAIITVVDVRRFF